MPLTLSLSHWRLCHIIDCAKSESFMLENARLLGDRRLAEEALDLPARSRFGEGRAEPFIV
jgi:hypothetical protein